ncbi:cold-shock DNA-binding domain protein [Leptotrichia wadei]|uniref:Cold-shock DNA-binding domain protein n=1 Tax=Leptotrichia wadei TaxID=157687 RepID=A0A7U6LC24_9FUSO|nr:cold-shock DNA-binding domain protein [Leptotrichia wadei]
MYDCTLREDFEDYKEMQIDNYVSQINQNTIRVEKMEIALKEPKKQVWIITKGGNSKTRSIKEKERVKIKEINIENLIELLSSKITNPRVDISDKLGRLGDME